MDPAESGNLSRSCHRIAVRVFPDQQSHATPEYGTMGADPETIFNKAYAAPPNRLHAETIDKA
jgi:hypothetical protein